MEENFETKSSKYGSKDWLRSDIPDREKKENEGGLSKDEQQQASYQDVKLSCFTAYLYRRNLLDKNNEELTQLAWDKIGLRIKQYQLDIKEAAQTEKINLTKLPPVALFPSGNLSPLERHLAEFFDAPSSSDQENEQIKLTRESTNIKEKIWQLCFNFDETTGELLDETQISYEDIMNTLYDHNNGDLATIVNNTAQALSGAQFFNITGNDVIDFREKLFDGRIYAPPQGEHNWSNNLAWLLAHIHKGDNVIIHSKITPDLLKRKTKGYEDELSGFAREAALLYKLGYSFTKVDGLYQATPPIEKNLYLSNLSITEALMTDEEVEHYYKDLMHSLDVKELVNLKKSEPMSEENKKRKLAITKDTMFSVSPVEQIKTEIPTIVNTVVENIVEEQLENKSKKSKTDPKE